MKKKMWLAAILVGLVIFGAFAWTVTVRAGYESAEYSVLEKDGNIEIREYPDLMLASTNTKIDSQGRDGSFMRLFRYISGENEADEKISMTTPVFMEDGADGERSKMGFVVPKEVAESGAPEPKSPEVTVRKREGGRFAVIRFSGKLNVESSESAERKLRDWMDSRGLNGSAQTEVAGYDPPFTPGPLRRNEVLIRLNDTDQTVPQVGMPQ